MPRASQLRQPAPTVSGRGRARRVCCAIDAAALLALIPLPGRAAPDGESARRALEIEAYLPGHPKRALAEIAELLPRADAMPAERRRLQALQGQALFELGRVAEGKRLTDEALAG
jgi:hypothetical protein